MICLRTEGACARSIHRCVRSIHRCVRSIHKIYIKQDNRAFLKGCRCICQMGSRKIRVRCGLASSLQFVDVRVPGLVFNIGIDLPGKPLHFWSCAGPQTRPDSRPPETEINSIRYNPVKQN